MFDEHLHRAAYGEQCEKAEQYRERRCTHRTISDKMRESDTCKHRRDPCISTEAVVSDDARARMDESDGYWKQREEHESKPHTTLCACFTEQRDGCRKKERKIEDMRLCRTKHQERHLVERWVNVGEPDVRFDRHHRADRGYREDSHQTDVPQHGHKAARIRAAFARG